jgi:hypothetical protein
MFFELLQRGFVQVTTAERLWLLKHVTTCESCYGAMMHVITEGVRQGATIPQEMIDETHDLVQYDMQDPEAVELFHKIFDK